MHGGIRQSERPRHLQLGPDWPDEAARGAVVLVDEALLLVEAQASLQSSTGIEWPFTPDPGHPLDREQWAGEQLSWVLLAPLADEII